MFGGSLEHGSPHGKWHSKLKVCHREVKWQVPFSRIPLHSPRIKDPTRNVTREEVRDLLQLLMSQGVITRVTTGEKAMYSLPLFLRRSYGKVRKSIDYMLLYAYSAPWTTSKTNVQEMLGSIPKYWTLFQVLDLE